MVTSCTYRGLNRDLNRCLLDFNSLSRSSLCCLLNQSLHLFFSDTTSTTTICLITIFLRRLDTEGAQNACKHAGYKMSDPAFCSGIPRAGGNLIYARVKIPPDQTKIPNRTKVERIASCSSESSILSLSFPRGPFLVSSTSLLLQALITGKGNFI